MNKNPWLGLQTYVEGDALYGRDEDIRKLSQYIFADKETVLFGKSGIGKSSVLNAGVIPMARMKEFTPVIIRLVHDNDAESYITQIGNRLSSAGILLEDNNPKILWELLHGKLTNQSSGEPAKLLLIFDQFEEIFTLQQDSRKKSSFFHELADIINDVMPDSLLSAEYSTADTKMSSNEPAESIDVCLDDLDFVISDRDDSLNYDNDVHLVFTLREDFLSEFEYYTATIPSLKQHRYGLRPINEEQAAEIILKPRKGLVAKDVAKTIIEKVANRSDFLLDGTPEIEVDAAVLSLYLSKLYEKSDGNVITMELVEKEASNIIKEFYEECVDGIPNDIIDKLEDAFVNKEGHRDNKSLIALSKEIGRKEYINQLIQKKLLRTFKYAGEEKVELIHDVLCDVVRIRKEEREKRLQQETERLLLRRQNTRNKIRFYIVSFVLGLAICVIAGLMVYNQQLKDNAGFGIHQEFSLKLSEDSLVTADNEFWKAKLLLIAIGDTINDTIINQEVNKVYRDSTFRFPADSVKYFQITLDFANSSNKKYYKNIIQKEIPIGYFTRNKEYILKVEYDNSRMVKYRGQLIADVEGDNINLQDAIVILRDQVRHTDAQGMFEFIFEDSLTEDEMITFVRKGFNSSEVSVFNNGLLREQYIITPNDSLMSFTMKCLSLDSIQYKFKYEPESDVRFVDGRKDKIVFRAYSVGSSGLNRARITGCYYFKSEYESAEPEDRIKTFHLISGWKCEKWGNPESIGAKGTSAIQSFEFVGYDKVHNKYSIKGWRDKDAKFHGTISDMSGVIAKFGDYD